MSFRHARTVLPGLVLALIPLGGSTAHEIVGNRPKFETYTTQTKVVLEKQVTNWVTEPIYGEQTVVTTRSMSESATGR